MAHPRGVLRSGSGRLTRLMLSQADNEMLARVGPPLCGALMRRRF
jgi:hypothetical protein